MPGDCVSMYRHQEYERHLETTVSDEQKKSVRSAMVNYWLSTVSSHSRASLQHDDNFLTDSPEAQHLIFAWVFTGSFVLCRWRAKSSIYGGGDAGSQ